MSLGPSAPHAPRRKFESIRHGLVAWIPGRPGARIRRWVHRHLLASAGRMITIAAGVSLLGMSSISLGNGVHIHRNGFVNARGSRNRITVGDNVTLARDAWIDATGQGNEIQIHAGVRIGWAVRLISSGDLARISIGAWSMLDRNVDLRAHDDGNITLGRHVYVGPYTCIAGPGRVTIGDGTMIASHCSIYANDHVFRDPALPIKDQGLTKLGITIGVNCWLGSGVRVVDGVTIGDGSVIGAGAVVTKNIPPFSIAVGVPARVIRSRASHEPVPSTAELATSEA